MRTYYEMRSHVTIKGLDVLVTE
ncbi:hypothetical protein Golob_017942 [Gossypium lobatum]|uniref:Uncharacterized protein n=1 Tax=Gossypium lobatum TaxID=34289 RepID=A0A7J8M8Q3_9ROSI|nr:hypothetical protein [Gossypium lobatum]